MEIILHPEEPGLVKQQSYPQSILHRPRYFSVYNELPQRQLYQQNQHSINEQPSNLQISSDEGREQLLVHPGRGLKSLKKERYKKKVVDQSQARSPIKEPVSLNETKNHIFYQEAGDMSYRQLKVNFKEKRENLLRMRSLQRSQGANTQSMEKLNTCQYKLKKFEREWSMFKENFEQLHQSNSSIIKIEAPLTQRKKTPIDISEQTQQVIDTSVKPTLLKDTSTLHLAKEQLRKSNRRKSDYGIVQAFYRTRSQSPGQHQLAQDPIAALNESLRNTSKAIKTKGSQNFEEKVMKQIQTIQNSFFQSTNLTSSRNNNQSEMQPSSNYQTSLKKPANKPNYFSTAVVEQIQDESPYTQSVSNELISSRPCISARVFHVKLQPKQDGTPKYTLSSACHSRQQSEKSITLLKTTQTGRVSETRESHIEQMKRSFMSKCKTMSNSTYQVTDNRKAQTQRFNFAEQAKPSSALMPTVPEFVQKKKMSKKLNFKQLGDAEDIGYSPRETQVESTTNMRHTYQSTSKTSLNSTASTSVYTRNPVFASTVHNRSPKASKVRQTKINLTMKKGVGQLSLTQRMASAFNSGSKSIMSLKSKPQSKFTV